MHRSCGFLHLFKKPCRESDDVCYDKCYLFGRGRVAQMRDDDASKNASGNLDDIVSCSAREFEYGGTCKPLTTCSAQEFEVTAPSKTSDRMCKALTTCSAQEFEVTAPSKTSDRVCKAITTCSAGEYERRPPSETTDRVCASESTGCTAGDPGCKCYFRTPCRGRGRSRNCRQHTSCYKGLPGNWRPDPWAPGFRKPVLTEDDAALCLSNARAPKYGRYGAWMQDCGERKETGTRLAMSSTHAKKQRVNFDGSVVN